jgi:hypothetical protein
MIRQWINGYNDVTDELEFATLLQEFERKPTYGLDSHMLTWDVASALAGEQLPKQYVYFLESATE